MMTQKGIPYMNLSSTLSGVRGGYTAVCLVGLQ